MLETAPGRTWFATNWGGRTLEKRIFDRSATGRTSERLLPAEVVFHLTPCLGQGPAPNDETDITLRPLRGGLTSSKVAGVPYTIGKGRCVDPVANK
jgi:hypothetical protein